MENVKNKTNFSKSSSNVGKTQNAQKHLKHTCKHVQKIKSHAKKVGNHMRKHHKKYVGGLFAGFALFNTVKVIIALVGVLMSLQSPINTWAASCDPTEMTAVCEKQKLEFDKISCGCVCKKGSIWDSKENKCVDWNTYCENLGKVFDKKGSCVCGEGSEQVPGYSNCVKIENQESPFVVEKSLSIAAGTPLKIISEVGYVILGDGTQDTTITALKGKDPVESFEINAPSLVKNVEDIRGSLIKSQPNLKDQNFVAAFNVGAGLGTTIKSESKTSNKSMFTMFFEMKGLDIGTLLDVYVTDDAEMINWSRADSTKCRVQEYDGKIGCFVKNSTLSLFTFVEAQEQGIENTCEYNEAFCLDIMKQYGGDIRDPFWSGFYDECAAHADELVSLYQNTNKCEIFSSNHPFELVGFEQAYLDRLDSYFMANSVCNHQYCDCCNDNSELVRECDNIKSENCSNMFGEVYGPTCKSLLEEGSCENCACSLNEDICRQGDGTFDRDTCSCVFDGEGSQDDCTKLSQKIVGYRAQSELYGWSGFAPWLVLGDDRMSCVEECCTCELNQEICRELNGVGYFDRETCSCDIPSEAMGQCEELSQELQGTTHFVDGGGYYACAYECPDTSATEISCLSTWNNDNFLSGGFWAQNPTDENIICALYGGGPDDTTAYTEYWSGWNWGESCDVENMTVVYTSNLPNSLNDNTVYVLTNGTSTSTTPISNNCVAIVSRNGTYFNQSILFGTWFYSILDNVSFSGASLEIEESYNDSLNNIQSYNNRGDGIQVRYSSNMILNNIEVYNNIDQDNNGAGISLTTLSNSRLSNIETYGNSEGVGIYEVSNNNSFINVTSYDNFWYGISLYNSAYNVFNNIRVYDNSDGIYFEDNWGGNDTLTYSNILSNVQSYNNSWYGIRINGSSGNVLNNIQSYNNGAGGINMGGEFNALNNSQCYNNNEGIFVYGSFILNNVQAYNNSDGIAVDGTGVFNNVRSYNNGTGVFFEIYPNSHSNVTYYGEFRTFANDLNNNSFNNCSRATNGIQSLGWQQGQYIDAGIMSWNFITNPIDVDGDNLLNWAETMFPGLQGPQFERDIDNYSYGSGILLQKQPVMWNGSNIVATGTYDSGKFIGSNSTKLYGDLLMSDPEQSPFYVTGIAAGSPSFSSYSVFGDFSPWSIDKNINTRSSLTLGSDTDKLVVQIHNTNDEYTHFQKDLAILRPISCLSTWNNDNYLNSGFWNTYAGNNQTGHQQVICALYGSGNGDRTAYTEHWTGWDTAQCPLSSMNVIEISSLGGNSQLADNTIYVLTAGSVNGGYRMGKCSAIVSKVNGGTTLNFNDGSDGVYSSGDNNIIFDNLNIRNWPYGISLDRMDNATLHNLIISGVSNFGVSPMYVNSLIVNDVKIYGGNAAIENNGKGINATSVTGAKFNKIEIVGFAYGLRVGKSVSVDIENSYIYNNSYGISVESSTGCYLNNLNLYNNSMGIDVSASDSKNISINNTQVYNYGKPGIKCIDATNFVLNNVQVYNGDRDSSHYGIDIKCNNVKINNIMTYNLGMGLYIYNGNYYGNINSFGNVFGDNIQYMTAGSAINSNGVNWSAGTYSTSGNLSWELVTNPVAGSTYMLDWTKKISNNANRSEISAYLSQRTTAYSYGSGIKTQQQPVMWSGNTLVATGTYDSSKYIGSDVVKLKGALQVPSPIQSNTFYATGVDNGTPIFNKYSLFGNKTTANANINKGTRTQVTMNSGADFLVTQIYQTNSGNFATHFEKSAAIQGDTTPPTINITGPNSGCATGKTIRANVTDTGDGVNSIRYITTTSATCSASTFSTNAGTAYTNNSPINLTSSDNNNYVCFKAVDNAGNTAYKISNQITGIGGNTVSFGTATLLSPTNGAYTGIHTPRLTWSGISTSSSRTTDPCSELSGYVVQICRDINCTQIIQTSNVLPLPKYTAASLNDGKYYRRVKGINKAGIAGAWSSVWNFTVDTIAPNCTFSRQPSNTNLYVGGTGTFSVKCTDTNGIDQSNPSVVSVPSGALSFSSPSVSVISGYEYTYTYTAQSIGNAGITFNADSVRDPVGHPNGGISTATSIVVGDACGSWDNDNYLNASFWREQELTETMNGDNSRKDAKLICALYGGGPGDQTAYTKYWSGYVWGQSCDVANMRVVRTGTLPNILEDNTVYVLTTNATFNATTNMSNCSAVVGRTTWSWQNVITREHPTVNGYGFSGSQYNILDNLEGVNSHVSVGSDSTLHDLSLHGTSMCGNSYIGSIATIGNGNFVDDITIYIVGRGIQVKSNRNIIMNVDVYNFWDYGIHIPQGYGYNQFNNIHIHDSADEYCATDGRGIEFEMTNLDRNPTEGDTFNNMNIHNNKYGIMYTFHDPHQGGIGSVDWWNRFSFNNIQVYNNKSGGIYIGGLRNSVLNNVSSYNNGGYGIYSTNSSNKYYGVIELTGNNSSYAGLSAGSTGGILGAGSITGMTLNWNYMTNPIVVSGYVLEWTKDYAKLRGPIYGDNSNRTGYLWLNEELQSVIGYSYGIKTKTQTQPMKYNGNTLVYSDLPYDSEAYIGSNVKKINGTAEISCYQSISSQEEWGGSLTPTNPSAGISMNNSVSLCSNSNDSLRLTQAVARYPMACSVTGHSDNPTLTPKYSVFGLLSSSNLWVKTGVAINTKTGDIPNGSSSDTNNIVTQIWGSNYFATHFVGKNDNSCSTIPNTPTLVSPADESFLSSNSVSFSWNAGSVTCGTLSQYEIKICSGSCSTTTVTTNTYSTTLSDGDYTWSVREKDSEGNRSNRTSVRSFTIKTSLTCNQSWNNDNFLSGGFWSLNPTDDAIICALYGSGQSDKTAYTKGWSGFTWGNTCNVLGMDVVHTNTLPTTLSSNTIYVLETGKVINTGAVDMANCSAIVSKSGSVLYSIDQISGKGRISIEGKQYAILDNFGVDGRSTGGTMLGIYLSGSNSVTLNNVSTYNCVYGVYLRNGSNNILNNIQAYNNTRYGVSLYSSINNTLNNVQIYNNSQYGLAIASGSNNIFNNVQSYNNLYAGITLQRSSNNNTLNNIKSFNNGQAGILLSSSSNNKYYGELSIFGNSGTNGNDVPSVLTRSTTANSSLGRTAGQYSTIDNPYEIEHSIWNYITNPKMANGKYMLEFTGNRVSLRGVKNLTGEVDGYSYGKDTLTQVQPVVYNGSTFVTAGSYAVDEYVGGQTKSASVDSEKIQCIEDNNHNFVCDYLGDTVSPVFQRYKVFVLDENTESSIQTKGLQVSASSQNNISSTDFVSQMQSPASAQIPMMVHAQGNGDDEEPSVELVWNGVACTTGGQTFVVTGTFTEAVTGVDEGDLSVNRGAVVVGSFTEISDTVYRWQVRSNTGNNVISISINSGSYRDLAGNTGTASNTLSGSFDNVGPNNISIDNGTINECTSVTLTGHATDQGCAGINTGSAYNFSTQGYGLGVWGGNTFVLNSGDTRLGNESVFIYLRVRDSYGNISSNMMYELEIQDTQPTLTTSTLTYSTTISGTTTLYSNLISSMGAVDGACGAGTMSKTGSISCTYTSGNGSAQWSSNGIKVTPPSNAEGTGTCTVTFADDEGNTVNGTVKYRYDTKKPTCTISQGSCTSGALTLTLIGSEVLNKPSGWNGSTTGITFTKDVTSNEQVSVTVSDSVGNTGSCSITPTNYDVSGPTFTFANKTVNECTAGSLSITSVAQVGCAAAHTNPYSFDNSTWNSTSTWTFSTSTSQPGSGSKTAYVRDALGNTTSHTATWTISNVAPTANNFTLNSNVGNVARTGNWKTLSSAAEGNCGNGDLTASVVTNGSKGSCSINGNVITYTSNSNKTGSDSCVIRIKDNENSIVDVTVSVAGIDTVAPTCTIAEAACTSGALRLTLTASETINTPSGWTRTNGTTYYKDVTSNAQVTASISDTAGNGGNCNITPSHYDVQAPSTPTMNTITSCQTGTSLTVSSTSTSDNGCNGTVEYQFCKSTTNSTSNCSSTNVSSWNSSNSTIFSSLSNETTYYFFVRTKDGLGNTSSWSSSVSTQLDNTAPTTTATGLPNDWTGSNVTLTLSTNSNGCNSTNTTYYCIYDSGSSACNPTTQGTSVSVTCNNNTVCQKYVRYYSKDGLGNEETVQTTSVIKIDKKKPTCTTGYTPTGWTSGNVVVTFTGSDSGAGLSTSTPSPKTFTLNANGTQSYTFTDKVGNSQSCSVSISNIDKTKPNGGTISVGGTCTTGTSVVLTLSATDTGAGMGSMRFSCDNSTWSSWETYGTSKTWTFGNSYGCNTNDGTKTVYVQYRDALGNGTTSANTSVTMDRTAPVVTLTDNASCKKGGTAWTVTGSWSETVQGFVIGDISATNGTVSTDFGYSVNPLYRWTVTSPTSGYGTTTVTIGVGAVTDNCGNSNARTTVSWEYDNVAPTTPTMNTITSCQTGTSVTVSSTSVSDTGCNGTVEYQFCKSTTNSTSNCSSTNVSSWSSSNSATFGGLNNGTKYYFFVRSKDGLGNTSNWSSSVNTQLDNTAPTTIVTGLPSDWTGRDVTLTLSAGANGCNSTNTIYYCVYDSGSSACTPTTQGTSVSVTCSNNTVCQKYVRYYSKDGLGNAESIQTTSVIKIDKKKPTCGTWTYNPALNSCTTGNVTGTLSNSTDLGAGINVSGGSCSIASNGGTCNVSISDNVGNTETCTSTAASNIDRIAPTVTVTNVTGYECERLTGSVIANDPSPACGNLSYSWSGGTYGSTTSYGLSQDTVGTQTISVKVKDSAGNVTTKTVTYTWLDRVLTGHDFTGSTNVGNSAKTANWMTSSEAAAGSCETISYVSKTNGSHGTCTVNGNNITYAPTGNYEGDDSCTITITDGDTNKTITVTWKNIDTKKPTCSISANTTSCTSGGITLSMNTTGATKYSWTGFNSLVTTNTNKVVRANGSYNGYVQDEAGNTGSCSINVNNYDNQAPTVTVTNATGYECERLTGSVSANDPSPACGSLSYSWNGGSYGSTTSYGLSQNTTGTQNITVKVKDSAGNETTETVTYTWFDKELTMTGTYDLGLITSSIVIPDLTAQNVFNVTGYGSCESVTIITGSCVNATMSLNGNGLTITPTINVSGIGNCTVGFTDGDTTKTGTITFTVQTLVPNVEFSGTNGAQINPSQSCINRNRFIAQIAVTNTPDLGEYRYDFDGTSYSVYDSGLILMYNFDKVSALGESATVVKDLSNNNHTGTVNSATWTSNGMRGGAYSFAGNSSSYIRFTSLGILSNSSIVMWIKPNGGNWKHVAIVGNTIYVDGISSSITNNFIDIQNGYIGRKGSSYFKGQIDEVRVYNRALSLDEVQFLYRSNLSKINTGNWLFEVLNTCLDQSSRYSYTGYAKSLYTGEQSVGQTVQTCIPDLLITGGMDVDFGTYDVSETGFTIQTGYTTNVRVEDWIGRNGWTGSVRISSTFSGQNTTASISSSNFKMKHGNSIQDLGHYLTGIIPEINNGLVSLSSILSDYNNIQITGGAQGTPYFVPNYPAGDFMCNGGIYADKPELQLEIPAWQIGDTYVAKVYWTIEPQ